MMNTKEEIMARIDKIYDEKFIIEMADRIVGKERERWEELNGELYHLYSLLQEMD